MSVNAPGPEALHEEPSLGRSVALTTAALGAARVVALAAGIVAVGLASRYLGLHDYGALTAAMAYSSLFAVFTDLGLATVATREISRDPSQERQVLGQVLGLGFLLAVGAAALGIVLMNVIYGGQAGSATREAIEILLVQVLVAPVSSAGRAMFTARQRGYLIAWGDLALAVAMALFTALAVATDAGYRFVVIAISGGYVAQSAVVAVLLLRGGVRLRPSRKGGWPLMLLALPVAGTLLINYLYFRLDVVLLSWLKSDADVARYGLAYRVLEGLMVLPSYLMLALFPTIARSEGSRARLAMTIGTALGALEAAALGLGGLLAIFSSEIVVVLGGHKYASAGPVLAILSLALALSFVSGVFGTSLMALGHQPRLLLLSLGTLLVNLAANLLLIPPLGVDGAAIAVVLGELAGLTSASWYYRRVAGPPEGPAHRRLLAAGLVLGVLAAIKFALPLGGYPLPVLLVGGSLGIVLYAGALLRLGALPPAVVDQLPLPARFRKLDRSQ